MRYRNLVLFLVLAVVWGTAFTAIKAGLAYFPPVLFAAIRYDIAGVLMVAYAAYAVEDWRPRTRSEWRVVGVSAVLMIAAYHAFLFVGEQGTTSAVAAIIVALNPIATTAFARVLLPSERLSRRGLLGLAVGFVGVAILVNPDPVNPLTERVVSKLLVVAAVVSFALGAVLTQRSEAELPIETIEGWAMLGGALVMHLVSLGLGERYAAVTWTPTAVASMAYLAIAASAIGFLIYFDLLDRLGSIQINLISYAAPVAAAAAGILLLDERLTPYAIGGFVLIFVGFAILKWPALRASLPGRSAPGRP